MSELKLPLGSDPNKPPLAVNYGTEEDFTGAAGIWEGGVRLCGGTGMLHFLGAAVRFVTAKPSRCQTCERHRQPADTRILAFLVGKG